MMSPAPFCTRIPASGDTLIRDKVSVDRKDERGTSYSLNIVASFQPGE